MLAMVGRGHCSPCPAIGKHFLVTDSIATEIIDRLARERGLPRERIRLSDRLLQDIGLDGDVAVDLFVSLQERFGTDLTQLRENCSYHFRSARTLTWTVVVPIPSLIAAILVTGFTGSRAIDADARLGPMGLRGKAGETHPLPRLAKGPVPNGYRRRDTSASSRVANGWKRQSESDISRTPADAPQLALRRKLVRRLAAKLTAYQFTANGTVRGRLEAFGLPVYKILQ